jgi:8-oxo-dGTP diphosphatase
MKDYTGVKIALIINDQLVMIKRDDKPGLRFANMWDFPGGGRELDENPLECAKREIAEELSIKIKEQDVTWQKTFPAINNPNLTAYFFVAKISTSDAKMIKLGNEGQEWKLMKFEEFFERSDVITQLKDRFAAYLTQQGHNIIS